MKLLTISVASYNVEKFIGKTLDSLCCKHMENLEVFVVDDGGTDSTFEIAQQYANRYPGCIIPVHKQNGGWGSTVNYSINHATGKYFKLLDGDDYFCTANLGRLLDILENTDADIVYTPYARFDDATGRMIDFFDISSSYALYEKIQLKSLNIISGLDMHAIMPKTSVLQKHEVRITEKCFYTDNEYRTKVLAYSSTILFTDYLLYQYRVGRGEQSVDILGMSKHYMDSITAANAVIEFHKLLGEASSPCVESCVENGIVFAYRTLVILGLKDELILFDAALKKHGKFYHNMAMKEFGLLGKFGFKNLFYISFLTRMKYKYAAKVKLLINNSTK